MIDIEKIREAIDGIVERTGKSHEQVMQEILDASTAHAEMQTHPTQYYVGVSNKPDHPCIIAGPFTTVPRIKPHQYLYLKWFGKFLLTDEQGHVLNSQFRAPGRPNATA